MEQPNHPLNQIEHLNLDPHILKLSYHQHIDHSLLNNQHEEVAHRNQGDALNEIDHNQQEQPLINKQCVIPEPQASRQEQRPQEFIREPSNSSEPTETKDQLKSAVEKILNFETQLNPIQPETQLNPIQPETQLNPIQSGERKILHERDNRKDTQSSQSVLQSSEIILPINRFLFPESEQSLVFHPNQLQYIDRIRQESQNSPNHPLSHLVVSVGKIPPAPGTSAGQPFDDGFTCIIPQSPPPHTEIYHQPINCDESNQPDPNLLPSSNLPSRRVGRPRKSIPNYNDSRSYTQSRRSNPQKTVKDKKPAVELASQQDTENVRIPFGGSPLPTRPTPNNKSADPESSITRLIPLTTEPSPMSRKKEPWLGELKITYAANLNKHTLSDLLVPYPKVGDTFKTVENFKEACLLASWPAGHDMHVRNHYKTDLWERCVFTCRHDRSPPKGLNCPFKIVAMGDKTNENPLQPIEVWKVIKSHLVHRNHPVGPGMYDPLGKRSYRKRTITDDPNESHGQQATSNTSIPPKKRGRPPRARSSVQTVQTDKGSRPKPPPSVAFPAPTAITEWAGLSPFSPSSASSKSDDYFPRPSSDSSVIVNDIKE